MASRLDPFALAAGAAGDLVERTGTTPFDVAIVLGTGLGAASLEIGEPSTVVPFDALPGFAELSAPGHTGEIWAVDVGGKRVLVFKGRAHLYEGHSPSVVAHGVRTAVASGCSTVILTNAAGAINADLHPGDLVMISDHLNMTGKSPLTSVISTATVRSPFVDLTNLWSSRLRAVLHVLDPDLPEGVYAQMPGPHFETPAEIRALRVMGADLVGMSTSIEAIAAHHAGAEVLGLSVVSNVAAGLHVAGGAERTGILVGEIESISTNAAPRVGQLLRELVADPGVAGPDLHG